MNKKEIIEEEIKITNEFKSAIESFLNELDFYGWELNDEGDIVDKKTKKLVWDIVYEKK